MQQPGFRHKGGVALGEDGNFFDSDAVLHTPIPIQKSGGLSEDGSQYFV